MVYCKNIAGNEGAHGCWSYCDIIISVCKYTVGGQFVVVADYPDTVGVIDVKSLGTTILREDKIAGSCVGKYSCNFGSGGVADKNDIFRACRESLEISAVGRGQEIVADDKRISGYSCSDITAIDVSVSAILQYSSVA